ncbi:DNA methyltransferase [Croceicoccus sp. Ery5]|uniref:DNA methyltransferase n=1 Tax=Croceicoccus sp. Ery5 TaxID=1703340 RepID=UPI001E641D1E|nr:DNA methyltransferase [Croceicoccus sp. Ery5]
MRLNWNEIRVRAAKFAKDWADAHYEKGETQSFYNEFFEVFGVQRRRVAVYERQVKKLNNKQGFIDLFWPGVLLVEQKSAGRDLAKARLQADEYCLGLKPNEFPRYVLVSDFQTFELFDLEEQTEVEFTLSELPEKVEHLGFIIGVQKRTFSDQDPVNIDASELMGKVHDALEESGYAGHDLEQFLVRLLFCLFADDTGIFEPRGIFETLIKDRTAEDGSDLGQWISQLFDVLNTPENERYKTLDEDLAEFPYVNGDLFAARLPIPSFDSEMRKVFIEACEFSWDAISPAIFGSLFQSVMDREERRKQGAHYTTEKNIMKVIRPLFLDGLREEFERIKSRKTQRQKLLREFQDKLASLKLFDPACGCGNFLIIAYRELRQLELEVLIEMRTDQQLTLDAINLSKVDVDQFHGIEIGEFPARIAEVAMWMMDHIMNNRLSLEFGQIYVRIPLRKSPHIVHGDALETDWNDVLAAKVCSYVLGNPPFIGAKYQSDEQREQVRRIAALGKSGGTLDYVSAWFLKAADYVQDTEAQVGFVSTNSITQGEQVAQLWPSLFQKFKLEITFAHRTFAWGSDARGKAHVHVVIIGLAGRKNAPTDRRLFSYDDINGEPLESKHAAITAYLFDAGSLQDRHLVVRETSKPLNGLAKLVIGSKPIDGGYFIMSREERDELIKTHPQAKDHVHPYIGSRELLHGEERFIMNLADVPPTVLKSVQPFRDAITNVRAYRQGKIAAKGKALNKIKKPGISSLQLAETPRKYHVTVVPEVPFLVIPKVSSERREYVPIAYLSPPTIPSDLVFVLGEGGKQAFALLTSAMHMAWMRATSGRLESRYRYAIGLVYNTFPLPAKMPAKGKLDPLVDAVLSARAKHPDTCLADLYDPDLMPSNLKKAHAALDHAIDRLYKPSGFKSERERVEYLFQRYEKMIAPLVTQAKPKRKRSKK